MADQHYNPETGDRTLPVERKTAIQIGTGTFHFSVWMSRYVFDHLTHEDWMQIGARLRDHKERELRKAVLDGSYFGGNGFERVGRSCADAARQIVWEQFRKVRVKAGDMACQIDALLCGERYAA